MSGTVTRILHIVGTLGHSGTTTQLTLLAASLPRDELDMHVCALDAGGPVADELRGCGIEPVVIGRRGTFDLLAFHRLRRHIRRLSPEVVQTWQFAAGAYGRIAARSVGVHRLVAVEPHLDTERTDLEWSLQRRLACRTDCIVVNSLAARRFYLAHGLPQQKLTVISNGVRPAEPARLSRAEWLTQLGLPSEAKLAAYVGPLVKRKRLKELIWAADQLKALGLPAHLLMVGDGPLRQALQRYRWLNRLDDRVHFLGWRDDVAELLAHTDVLWQAGTHEGQSNALLEAMAAGVPVVAADAAGNRELVRHGENGYLVPLDERAGFARWTLPLLEDPQLAQRFGATGRQRAQREHRVEDMVARYAALYRHPATL